MKTILKATAAAAALLASGAAFAADLPSRKAAPAPVYVPPAFTWTGFYVGANAGYGFGRVRTSGAVNNLDDPQGFIAGGQVGYNYQIGQFVIGGEADLQYSDINAGPNALGLGFVTKGKIDYFGTVRARAGVAFDRLFVYGTGGYAFARASVDLTPAGAAAIGLPGITGAKHDHNGYVLGAGVEYAFTNNLTAKVEYLYVDLEKKQTFSLLPVKSGADFSVVRAGVNYKF